MAAALSRPVEGEREQAACALDGRACLLQVRVREALRPNSDEPNGAELPSASAEGQGHLVGRTAPTIEHAQEAPRGQRKRVAAVIDFIYDDRPLIGISRVGDGLSQEASKRPDVVEPLIVVPVPAHAGKVDDWRQRLTSHGALRSL